MDFIPYKANEHLENTFYQVPKELFVNDNYKSLNSDSKLLYALLLDRLSVSRKHEWFDEDNNIYLIFSRKEASEKLKLSDKTVTKAFKQLNTVKLIFEKKQGKNKPNLIYVDKINHDKNIVKWTRKNYDSRIVKSTTQDTENLRCSNNKYSKNNYSNTHSKNNSFFNYESRDYSAEELDKLYCNVYKN